MKNWLRKNKKSIIIAVVLAAAITFFFLLGIGTECPSWLSQSDCNGYPFPWRAYNYGCIGSSDNEIFVWGIIGNFLTCLALVGGLTYLIVQWRKKISHKRSIAFALVFTVVLAAAITFFTPIIVRDCPDLLDQQVYQPRCHGYPLPWMKVSHPDTGTYAYQYYVWGMIGNFFIYFALVGGSAYLIMRHRKHKSDNEGAQIQSKDGKAK